MADAAAYRRGRTLLRIDAVFELTLAGIALALVVAGADLRAIFGLPPLVVYALATALLALGVFLALSPPTVSLMQSLAAGNLAGAAIFAIWVVVKRGDMTSGGIAFILVIAAGLAILGGAQLGHVRRVATVHAPR